MYVIGFLCRAEVFSGEVMNNVFLVCWGGWAACSVGENDIHLLARMMTPRERKAHTHTHTHTHSHAHTRTHM